MSTMPAILFRRSVLSCLMIFVTLSLVGADFFPLTNLMSYPRSKALSVELPDGRVFIYGDAPAITVGSLWIDLYEPADQTFTRLTNSLLLGRSQGTVTLLPNGKVLLTGGAVAVAVTNNGIPSIAQLPTTQTELFNPSTHTSSLGASLLVARSMHQATLLANGDVLITGGRTFTPPNTVSTTTAAEIYKSALNIIVPVGNLNVPRYSHTATLLQDGRVLLVGGVVSNAASTAELFDPQSQTFTLVNGPINSRTSHRTTLLNDGRVLITGGQTTNSSTATSEVFDPQTNGFRSVGNMTVGRRFHTSTLLPNGQVLIAGGSAPTNIGAVATATTEIFDPVANTFSAGENMTSTRDSASSVLLSNGQTLISGGINNSNVLLRTAEIYDPELYIRMSGLVALQNQISALSNDLAACEATHAQDILLISQLTNQVNLLAQTNSVLSTQLADALNQNAALSNANSLLQSHLTTSLISNSVLSGQVAVLTQTSVSLQTQLEVTITANSALTNQVALLEQHVIQLQSDLGAAQAANQSLTNQITALNLLVTQLNGTIGSIGQSTTNLTAFLRNEFGNPSFVIAGTNIEQQVQSLITGITNLNHGKLNALYDQLK